MLHTVFANRELRKNFLSCASPRGPTKMCPGGVHPDRGGHLCACAAWDRGHGGCVSGCRRSAQAGVLFWRSTSGRPRWGTAVCAFPRPGIDSAKAVRMAHLTRRFVFLFAWSTQAWLLGIAVIASAAACSLPPFPPEGTTSTKTSTSTGTTTRLDSGVWDARKADAPSVVQDAPPRTLDGPAAVPDAPPWTPDGPAVSTDVQTMIPDGPAPSLDAPPATIDGPAPSLDAPPATIDGPRASQDVKLPDGPGVSLTSGHRMPPARTLPQ